MPSWSIGGQGEAIEVEILSMPEKDGGYDWVSACVHASVGAFHADVNMTILARELEPFRDDLESLYRDLKGSARLTTMENQLGLNVEVNHLGHVRVSGHLRDDASFGNRLTFELGIDQTYLKQTISQLNATISELHE